MSYQTIELATTVPLNEPCAQVGSPDYGRLSRLEASALISQITREVGAPPPGAYLQTKSNPHDFGSYLDVIVKYEVENEDAINYAYRVESSVPFEWDDDSIVELTEAGYNIDR